MKPAICECCGRPSDRPIPDDATDVSCWHCDNGATPKRRQKDYARIKEIDAMFEAATGWGSWMAEAAKERKALADKWGLPHKHLLRQGEPCRHLEARLHGSEPIGQLTCPNCGLVWIGDVINNLLDEVRKQLKVAP